jgi:3-hydroxyacyl-CoA dehydrogenase/3-hydroxy-2-methylbutyryl-CoA dehydrogenase
MEIAGCVAAVTGGASGLGEACVRYLTDRGAKAAIFDVNAERGEQIAGELGDSVIFANTDVVDENSVKAAIDKTIGAFGAIHVAINCAGTGQAIKVLSKKGPYPLDSFSFIIRLNLIGTFNVIRLVAEKMVQNEPNADGEKGVFINTASAAATEGQIGQAAYSASKAGVVGMTLPIAREFADYGLRVVTVAPGLFETPLLMGLPDHVREALSQSVPFPRRLGKPSEFALLAGQIIENPMLNGNTIRLDGAIRMAAR